MECANAEGVLVMSIFDFLLNMNSLEILLNGESTMDGTKLINT